MEETKIIRLVVDGSRAKSGASDAERALKAVESQGERTLSALSRLGAGLEAVAGWLRAFIVLWAIEKIVQFVSWIDGAAASLGELSEQLGVNTQYLQAMQAAAAQAGVKNEELEKGIARFTRTVGEAAQGNEEAIKAFERLGVKMLDAQGNLRPTEHLITEVARRILDMGDNAKQAAASVDFFGKSGQKFLTLLGEMAKGPDDLVTAARRMGLVIDEAVIRKLDEMSDKAEMSSLKIRVLFAQLYTPIKATALEYIAGQMQLIGQLIDWARGKWREFLAWISGSGTPEQAIGTLTRQLEQARADYAAEQQRIGAMNPGDARLQASAASILENYRRQEARIVDLERRLQALQVDNSRELGGPPIPPSFAGGALPDAPGVGNPRGTGRGGSDRSARDYDRARESLDRYIEGLRRERDEVQLTDVARAEHVARIRAEELARNPALKLTEEQIKAYGDEAAALAKATAEGRDYQREQERIQREQERAAERQADLMLEPMRNAIRGLQTTLTDFFEQLYGGGVASFKALTQSMRAIWVRMLAEMTSQWLMSQSQMQQASASGGSPMMGGGSNPLGFLQQRMGGQGGGMNLPFLGGNTGAVGVANQWQNVDAPIGALNMSQGLNQGTAGLGMSGQYGGMMGATGSFGGGAGWMGMIGVGMGAMQAATSRTTGGRIAGTGQAVGSALMMIPSPWTMAAGAIISIGSQIFGAIWDRKHRPSPQAATDIMIDETGQAFVADSRTRDGGNWRGTTAAARSIAEAVNRFGAVNGLRLGSGAVGGYILNSQGANTGDQWIAGVGSYALGPWVDPANLGKFDWKEGLITDLPADNARRAQELADGLSGDEAVQRVISGIWKRAATDGTLIIEASGILADTITRVFQNSSAVTADELQTDLDYAKAYARIAEGKQAAQGTRDAVQEIVENMRAMRFEAERLGLDTAILDQRMQEDLDRIAANDNDTFRRGLLGMNDPLALALEDLATERQESLDRANYLATVSNVLVDINRLEEYYGRRRAQIVEQFYGQTLGGLEQLIRRLTFGDLALATPPQAFSGLQATYQGIYERALAGDQSARGSIVGLSAELAQAGNLFYGGDARAAALRSQLVADAATLAAAIGSGANTAADIQAGLAPLVAALLEAVQAMQAGAENSSEAAEAIDNLTAALRNGTMPVSDSTVLAA